MINLLFLFWEEAWNPVCASPQNHPNFKCLIATCGSQPPYTAAGAVASEQTVLRKAATRNSHYTARGYWLVSTAFQIMGKIHSILPTKCLHFPNPFSSHKEQFCIQGILKFFSCPHWFISRRLCSCRQLCAGVSYLTANLAQVQDPLPRSHVDVKTNIPEHQGQQSFPRSWCVCSFGF